MIEKSYHPDWYDEGATLLEQQPGCSIISYPCSGTSILYDYAIFPGIDLILWISTVQIFLKSQIRSETYWNFVIIKKGGLNSSLKAIKYFISSRVNSVSTVC